MHLGVPGGFLTNQLIFNRLFELLRIEVEKPHSIVKQDIPLLIIG